MTSQTKQYVNERFKKGSLEDFLKFLCLGLRGGSTASRLVKLARAAACFMAPRCQSSVEDSQMIGDLLEIPRRSKSP